MADKEGSAGWKWLYDFHARVLKGEEGRGAKTKERHSTKARHSTKGREPKHIFFAGGAG